MTINAEQFKKDYMELKQWGTSDKDIADRICMDIKTLRKYKKLLGLQGLYPKSNLYSITEEHFKAAEQIGISRANVYARVSNYEWPIEKAISTPVIPLNKRRSAKAL